MTSGYTIECGHRVWT